MKPQVIVTDDGSNTIYLPGLDETYHSKFGAINEARHVFIENGLCRVNKTKIHVLEIGFGTGLNALLSLLYAQQNKLTVEYTSIEKFPLENDLVVSLNYSKQISGAEELFPKIHTAEWGQKVEIIPRFSLKKIKADILAPKLQLPSEIDIVFFDAFAPSKQQELWNELLFSKLHNCLGKDGKFVTYSAAGLVKRALRAAGFQVKRLPGPQGKHHMLFCQK